MITVFGLWLIADGLASFILVEDKYWAWQIARAVRILIGIYLSSPI